MAPLKTIVRRPSGVAMGWWPLAGSNIARRRIPSVAGPLDAIPESSGPRWTMAAHIRATASSRAAAGAPGSTIPAMPHMDFENASPRRIRGWRRQGAGLGRTWGRSGGAQPNQDNNYEPPRAQPFRGGYF